MAVEVSHDGQVTIVIASVIVIPLLLLFSEIIWRWVKPSKSLFNKHVIVVGGSSGIGKSMAIQAAQHNARAVTIISRSMSNLEAAKVDILAASSKCDVKVISADITKHDETIQAIDDAINEHGAPDYLVCAAGAAFPGYFLEQGMDVFKKSVELNYLGTVSCAKAALPHMVAAKSGHVVLISSGAGISGWLGYSSYSPTKFAVRGLGEALRNEFSGFNIKVSVAYPPDTDTVGFVEESKTKPAETVEMLMPSAHSPDVVANYIWYSVRKGDFNCSCPDILQDFLIALMSGVTPRRFYIFDVLIHPIAVMMTSAFRWNSDRVASKYPKRLDRQHRAAG